MTIRMHKVTIVNRRDFYDCFGWLNSFYERMFHGYGHRDNRDITEPNLFGQNQLSPFRLTKNITSLPHIIKPDGLASLVVSTTVRNKLRKLQNLEFAPVECERLFSYDYPPLDAKNPPIEESLPDEDIDIGLPAINACIDDRYWELVLPLYNDVHNSCDADIRICVDVRCGMERSEPLVATISEGMMRRYPILKHWQGYIFSDGAYNLVGPYLDTTYFEVVSTEVGEE